MFTTLVLVLHVVVSIALILIILLQSGKGADIGAVFGGGSNQTVFGSTGAATFLSKVTIAAAVIFMVTSIILTYFAGKGVGVKERSVMTEQSVPVSEGVAVPDPSKTSNGAPAAGAAKSEGVPADASKAAPAAAVPAEAPTPSATPAPAAAPSAPPSPAPAGEKPADAK
jgi:preprotein translocase subunit SecG